MKSYESFEEIEIHLKQLSLEKMIALEKLKLVKTDFKDSLKPMNFVSTALNFFGKFSTFLFVKKLFK